MKYYEILSEADGKEASKKFVDRYGTKKLDYVKFGWVVSKEDVKQENS